MRTPARVRGDLQADGNVVHETACNYRAIQNLVHYHEENLKYHEENLKYHEQNLKYHELNLKVHYHELETALPRKIKTFELPRLELCIIMTELSRAAYSALHTRSHCNFFFFFCTGSFGSVRMTLQYQESAALLNVTIHCCKVTQHVTCSPLMLSRVFPAPLLLQFSEHSAL